MPVTDKPPPLPPPNVVLIGPDGKPTKAGTDFLTAVIRYLEKLRAAIP